MKMDLIYIFPNEKQRKALEAFGATIEDASDFVHEERVAVYYPNEKADAYPKLLEEIDLKDSSLTVQTY